MPGEEKGVAKADKNSIGAPPNPACTAELRGVWPDTGLSTSICCRSGDLAFHARVSTNIRSDWVNQPVRRQHLRLALLESAAGSGKVGLFRAACQNHAAAFPLWLRSCWLPGSARYLLAGCSESAGLLAGVAELVAKQSAPSRLENDCACAAKVITLLGAYERHGHMYVMTPLMDANLKQVLKAITETHHAVLLRQLL